jgi:L-seryl-tRNA(Ser) seleniumtransferase
MRRSRTPAGSFAASGARLKEVGTDDRVALNDYEGAITERTGLLMTVHTGNSPASGHDADVELPALVVVGRGRGIPVMEVLENGALVDLSRYGRPKVALVSERLLRGADVVTFSGDTIVGGPQAGMVSAARPAPARSAETRCTRHFSSKLTIAALEATLRLYRVCSHRAGDSRCEPDAKLEEVGKTRPHGRCRARVSA